MSSPPSVGSEGFVSNVGFESLRSEDYATARSEAEGFDPTPRTADVYLSSSSNEDRQEFYSSREDHAAVTMPFAPSPTAAAAPGGYSISIDPTRAPRILPSTTGTTEGADAGADTGAGVGASAHAGHVVGAAADSGAAEAGGYGGGGSGGGGGGVGESEGLVDETAESKDGGYGGYSEETGEWTEEEWAAYNATQAEHCAEGEEMGGAPPDTPDADAAALADLTEGLSVEDIFSLARHNKVDRVTDLLERGLPVNVRDAHGNTVLSIACQNGLKRMAKAALRKGADMNAVNHRGNSALHFCYMYGYGDTLGQYLISKGADSMLKNYDGLVCFDVTNALS